MNLKTLLKGRKSARLVYRKDTKEILGIFHEWRKENPHESVSTGSNFATVTVGQPFTDYPHDKQANRIHCVQEHSLRPGASIASRSIHCVQEHPLRPGASIAFRSIHCVQEHPLRSGASIAYYVNFYHNFT